MARFQNRNRLDTKPSSTGPSTDVPATNTATSPSSIQQSIEGDQAKAGPEEGKGKGKKKKSKKKSKN